MQIAIYGSGISDEYMEAKTHAIVMPMLRLKGTSPGERGMGDRALTRYEWECAHRALRILLKVLDPGSNLTIEEPRIPQGD
jgi:hypothetical protein